MLHKNKVIIVGPAFPLRGGIANSNEELCRAMNVAGIDAKIFSFSLQYPNFLFPGKTQYDNGVGPNDIIIETKINSVNPLNWLKVAKQIKSEKPGYVIFRYWLPFMGPCMGTIAWLIKRGTNIKTIAITDNVIPHEKRPGDKIFTQYFVKQCDGFIAMSQSVLNDLNVFTNTNKKTFLPLPMNGLFGEKVTKSRAAYEYLVESISNFPDAETFKNMISEAKFDNVSYKLLNCGIAAIHEGFKYS